ncbi:toprim domain-containing protein [Lactococcus garvieae]|uniref:zinc peptidase n=1 Tax=Lactococcus garvieae TaxID=1363 RepID=UPI00308FBD5D|nr:hypothetical protein LG21E12_14410 [Lactococcus garvieae]
MAEYRKPVSRVLHSHKDRERMIEEASNKNIIEVALSLGMRLRKVGQDYAWEEHDSLKLVTKKNYFYWNAQRIGGGPINLVKLMKECSKKEAVTYLTGKQLGVFTESVEPRKEFQYYLKDKMDTSLIRSYFKNKRSLSDETIDFFISQGVLSQANYKNRDTGKFEPVAVFKAFDHKGKMQGMTVQGIQDNSLYGKRHAVKKSHGDGFYGMTVKVGKPPTPQEMSSERPLKIIAFEAPIDLMSYYELFKNKMGDAILVSMNGLRKGTISKLLSNIMRPDLEKSKEEQKATYLDDFDELMGKGAFASHDFLKVILAVDNDEIKWNDKLKKDMQPAQDFIKEFGVENIPVVPHVPKLIGGQTNNDWNAMLQELKKPRQSVFEQRTETAYEKRQEQSRNIEINPVVRAKK